MDEAPSRGPYKADGEISQRPRGATDSPAPRGAPSQGLPTTAGTCPLKHRGPASCSILDGKGSHQQDSGIWGHSAICLGSRFLCLATKTGLVCCFVLFCFFLKKIPGKRAWVKEVLQQHPVARRDGGAFVCPEPWPASIHRNRREEGREPRGWAPSPCVCRCPHMSCSVGKPTGPSLLWPCCKLWRCPCPRQGPSPRAPCRGSLPHHGRCGSC